MQSLTAHYRALLGLDDSWSVAGVDLALAEKLVVISLEFVVGAAVCPE